MTTTSSLDLGTQKVSVLFGRYFAPTLFAMLSMSAVTAIDGVFVGHGVGSDGIAAINICVPLYMVFTGLGLMVGAGASVVASLLLAKGNVLAARANITEAMLFVSFVALPPTVVMLLFPDETVVLLGASPTLLPMAREYLLWASPAFLVQLWVSVGLFAIRLDGSPRYAMMCSVASAAINVVLDWLFIFPLGLGLMGAAFASTLSVLLGGLMAVGYLGLWARRLRLLAPRWSVASVGRGLRHVGHQCRIGSSAMLAEATLAVLMFIGNKVFMSRLGDDGVGAFGIACYYIPFVFMIGNAIAQSAQPIISYNFGLGLFGRVRSAERLAIATALVCGVSVAGVFTFMPREMVGLFISTSLPAALIAIEGFPLFALAFVPFVVNIAIIGYFQSVERVVPATVLALLRGAVLLVPSFIVLPHLLGTPGIWTALAASETATTAIALAWIALRQCLGK